MAKEGLKFLLPTLLIWVIAFYLFTRTASRPVLYFSVVIFLFAFFFILSFRDPERKSPGGEDLILSPADGRVEKIEKSTAGSSQRISIFMSLFDVHVNRVPVDGVVKEISYKPGRFIPAFRDKASEANEKNIIVIENEHGEVILKQIAGSLSRRIVCNLDPGQHVKKGERFGLIHFGSLVELILPISVRVKVKEQERVKGGETVLGVFGSD
jgi:phosphatidylserine decarboxylase